MNILFVCALPLELSSLKKELQEREKRGHNFLFLLSGVGNYNTIFTLQNYLLNQEVDFIVNIGVCGVDPDLRRVPNPIVQVYRIKNLASKRESLLPLYFNIAPLVSLGSSEEIITKKEDLNGESFVDMESYGIDFVSTKMKIPYIILKIPFDRVSLQSREVNKKDLESVFETIDYTKIIETIDHFLGQNQKQNDIFLERYFSHYRFTFSEKEILKKFSKKYQVLYGNFDTFFEQNKDLGKKEFLLRLQAL